MPHYENYMRRCLQLASNGLGMVAPNPMVGAVLVHDGVIIGEGYHQQYGGPHAEVNALASVHDKSLLEKSTLYVNLEPCSHYGKTPPCADLIIQSKIPRVVIAQSDPNPLVAGKGIEKMRNAGIEVISDILSDDAEYLNRRFNTFYRLKRPYVVLKWAQTIDGYIDVDRSKVQVNGIHWISNPATKKLVHQWRSCELAILVGARTVRNDNPSLTVREIEGKSPLRVVLSERGNLPQGSQLLNDGLPTWVINRERSEINGVVKYIAATAQQSLIDAALESLAAASIISVLIEGGAHTLKSFIDKEIWDEARIITSPSRMPAGSGGAKAPTIEGTEREKFSYAGDLISILIPGAK